MNPDRIQEKIKSLLRLGTSSNKNEAEQAMRRAFELAAKHQIDVHTLSLDDDERRIVEEAVRVGWSLPFDRKLTLGLLQSFFNVHTIICTPDVKFIGTAPNVAVAKHVHDFIIAEHRARLKRWSDTFRRPPEGNQKKNFTQGFFYGLASNLTVARDAMLTEHNGLAMVLVSEKARRDEFVSEHIGKTRPVERYEPKRKNRTAIMHGYHEGRKVQIHDTLKDANKPQEQLT